MSTYGHGIFPAVAVTTIATGYLVDWNRTHVKHPSWPPHAKFHDAWTILLGTGLGSVSLRCLRKGNLEMAAVLPAIFYASQAGSFAFPGTGGLASEFPELVPKVAGVPFDEAVRSVAMLLLTGAGYGLARRERA